MARGLWERLRSARGFGVLTLLALMALLALVLSQDGGAPPGGSTELETRLERILSLVNPNGDVHVMVREDGEGGVAGAVVVAEGLTNLSTFLELQEAVTTLLQIDASRVEIIGGQWMGG